MAKNKKDYLDGYRLGVRFVNRYKAYPKLVMQYAKFHSGRYRQTENDNGFLDALMLAYGL